MKFKIGELVRIKDGSNIPDYTGSWVWGMNAYVEQVHKVVKRGTKGGMAYYILDKCGDLHWDERGLRAVTDYDITIERHGQKVVAKMGKKTGVAKCSPDDEFDMFEGSLIALNRLFGKEPEEATPKFIKGDIVKVIKDDNWIPKNTIGRVVEVVKNRILVKHTNKDGDDVLWWIDANKCKLVLKA